MEIYQAVVDYLLHFSIFDEWPEMASILRRSASTRPRDWNLPPLLGEAVGVSAESALPGSAALACAQISIILTDDMLDNDPRGEYQRIGYGRAANFALAFQAAGVNALLKNRSSSKVKREAVNSLNQMMFKTAFGQELDVKNPNDEKAYWQVVVNKSAPFYGCAFQLGAVFAEADAQTIHAIKRLGGLYGEMIQIHDDLNDTLAVPANPDWLLERRPLPILFAQVVTHPERERFITLCQNIASAGALQEAQDILIRCGAVSYCVDQLLHRHKTAQTILDKISLPTKETIDTLIAELVTPIQRLFEALGLRSQVG